MYTADRARPSASAAGPLWTRDRVLPPSRPFLSPMKVYVYCSGAACFDHPPPLLSLFHGLCLPRSQRSTDRCEVYCNGVCLCLLAALRAADFEAQAPPSPISEPSLDVFLRIGTGYRGRVRLSLAFRAVSTLPGCSPPPSDCDRPTCLSWPANAWEPLSSISAKLDSGMQSSRRTTHLPSHRNCTPSPACQRQGAFIHNIG